MMPTLTSNFPESVTPTETDARLARESVQQLARLLETNQEDPRFRIQRDGELADPIAVPLSAIRLLKNILAAMAQGHGNAMVTLNTELTPEQASELLNVSRPYFMSPLDEAKIPFRLDGPNRLVRVEDVMSFKRKNDRDRLTVLGELVAPAQE